MNKACKTTWLDYIDKFKDSDIDPAGFKQESIEQFTRLNQGSVFQHTIPLVYLLDYTTGKYISMSNSVKLTLGYIPEDFTNGGLDFTLENYHRDDMQLFSNQIFVERLAILKDIPPSEHADYIFSYNFRFLNRRREYVNVLQRNCFIRSDDKGNPLLSMGMIANIDHFKNHNPVIQTVEKLSYDPETAPSTVYKKAFFLHDENKLVTRREKEVLLWTAEGLTSKEIAGKLCLSENTIINHRRNMQEKTNTRNVVELVSFAIRNGII